MKPSNAPGQIMHRIRSLGTGPALLVRRAAGEFSLYRHGRVISIELSETVAITGVNQDQITYEENFLVLTQADSSWIAVGELDEGMQMLEADLSSLLPGFLPQWQAAVECAMVGDQVALWARTPDSDATAS